MKNTEKIIAIVGPTASGKSNIAIQVAQKIGGEIISADSRLVYKDFNIGTAKPTQEELGLVPHYMIDIADPTETYTVSVYKKQASELIEDILSRNKVPIVAGGTGFYVKALLGGLNIPDVDPDEKFREEMQQFVAEHGNEALKAKLREIDPITADKLYTNDAFRIIRALEVYKATGKTMSEIQTITKPPYDISYIGLNAENRDYLYERINKRVDIMIEQGLIDEVKDLISKYGTTVSILKTLGYKEISEHFDGLKTLDQAVEEIKKNTRNFAKRQLTWFRANKEINWFYIDKMSYDEISNEIVAGYNV